MTINPLCDLDRDDAIVRIRLSDGCAAFPDAREQKLCATHWRSIEPRGECCILETYPLLESFRRFLTADFSPCPEHAEVPVC